MEEQSFEPGDTVKLRSGGPTMTVLFEGTHEVSCKWWNASAWKFEVDKFLPTSLRKSMPD